MIKQALSVALTASGLSVGAPALAVPPPVPDSEAEAKAWPAADQRREKVAAYRLTEAAEKQVRSFVGALAAGKKSELKTLLLPSAFFVSIDGAGEIISQPAIDLIDEEEATDDPHLQVNAVFDVGYGLAAAVQGLRHTTAGAVPSYSIYIFQFDDPKGSGEFRIRTVREVDLIDG